MNNKPKGFYFSENDLYLNSMSLEDFKRFFFLATKKDRNKEEEKEFQKLKNENLRSKRYDRK